MAKSKSATDAPICQIKVTLEDSKPPIWRRLLVSSDTTLGGLHDIIQAAFGWWDYHLHQFIVGETYFGVPDPDYEDYLEMNDEQDVRLRQVAPREGSRFRYEYDFGDSWLHQVLVEKILSPEPGQDYPVCIKGRRARPPEDVGGMWGYYHFLEAIGDPDHEEHDEYMEWVGGAFDPEAFDLMEVNQALAALRRKSTLLGKLPPMYRFILNPYTADRSPEPDRGVAGKPLCRARPRGHRQRLPGDRHRGAQSLARGNEAAQGHRRHASASSRFQSGAHCRVPTGGLVPGRRAG
jgi:hypothetical protein